MAISMSCTHPGDHWVRFDKVIGQYSKQVLALLESLELDRNLNSVFEGERSGESVPKIVEAQPTHRVWQRRVQNEAQRE